MTNKLLAKGKVIFLFTAYVDQYLKNYRRMGKEQELVEQHYLGDKDHQELQSNEIIQIAVRIGRCLILLHFTNTIGTFVTNPILLHYRICNKSTSLEETDHICPRDNVP